MERPRRLLVLTSFFYAGPFSNTGGRVRGSITGFSQWPVAGPGADSIGLSHRNPGDIGIVNWDMALIDTNFCFDLWYVTSCEKQAIFDAVCIIDSYAPDDCCTWIMSCILPANGRRRYIVTSPTIDWGHAQNDLVCFRRMYCVHTLSNVCMITDPS